MPREIIHDKGRGVSLVSLGADGEKGYATILTDDLEMLRSLGCSLAWSRYPTGYVVAPCIRSPSTYVSVARVLMDALPGQSVRYINGDCTNLVRDNLQVDSTKGHSYYRDRDWLNKTNRKMRIKERYLYGN